MEIRILDKANEEQVALLVGCYRRVFSESPWFETWTEDSVREIILEKDSYWWLAHESEVVVGFTAGTVKDQLDLAEKLGVPNSVLPAKKIGYQAELGVLSYYRGIRIADNLVKARKAWFHSQEAEILVVRTKPEAITYGWNIRLGYKVFYTYTDGRVLLQRAI